MGKKLFSSVTIGDLELSNRLIMAPMTRARAGSERLPNGLMAEYYTQRVTAGLIITEATQISETAAGWNETPGIHTQAQVDGWRKVTQSVHAQGGKIFLQLWHTGRASHPDFQPNGQPPVSSSAIAISNDQIHTPAGKKPYEVPRALETDEIPEVIQDYAEAARKAKEAGFDGVEIHAANGYLIDQFLRDGVNKRTDLYGGSLQNRVRFLLEVTAAVCQVWSPKRVGVRFSPSSGYNDMSDSDPQALFSYATEKLNAFGLAYLHILEALPGHFLAAEGERVWPHLRKIFKGPFIINGGYNLETGEGVLQSEGADAIAYGIPFIANPDLVKRFEREASLNQPDPNTFYTPGAKGYTDYPSLS